MCVVDCRCSAIQSFFLLCILKVKLLLLELELSGLKLLGVSPLRFHDLSDDVAPIRKLDLVLITCDKVSGQRILDWFQLIFESLDLVLDVAIVLDHLQHWISHWCRPTFRCCDCRS